MSKLQTRNAFSNTSLQDSDLFWIEVDLGGGIFESQKITGLQLKTILSQDPIVNDVVLIDQNTPTTGGVTFNPNTPLTQDILYLSTTNGSTWIYNGSAYVTYVMPVTSTTPFNIYGSSVDAGGNKTTSIQRTGDIYVGTNSLNSIVSASTGLAHTSNGFSQVFSTTYSNSEYPIIRQTRRRGTQASSTPAQSGDILGTHSFNSNGDAASISVKATETHGLTTRGSEIILSNCANGTASQVENLKVQQDGKIKVSNAYTLPSTAPTSGQVLGYSSAGVSDWQTLSFSVPQANKIYVDSINGVNATGRGRVDNPYLTPEYALSDITNTGTITATTTNSSNVLTSVSSTTNIVIGQYITGTGIPYDSVVVSKTSNSITLSRTCTASATITATWWTIYELQLNGNFVATSNWFKAGFFIDAGSSNISFGAFTLFAKTSAILIHESIKGGNWYGTNASSKFITQSTSSDNDIYIDVNNYYSIGTTQQIDLQLYSSTQRNIYFKCKTFDARFGSVGYFWANKEIYIEGIFYGLLYGLSAKSNGQGPININGSIETPSSITAFESSSSKLFVNANIVGQISLTSAHGVFNGLVNGTTHTISTSQYYKAFVFNGHITCTTLNLSGDGNIKFNSAIDCVNTNNTGGNINVEIFRGNYVGSGTSKAVLSSMQIPGNITPFRNITLTNTAEVTIINNPLQDGAIVYGAYPSISIASGCKITVLGFSYGAFTLLDGTFVNRGTFNLITRGAGSGLMSAIVGTLENNGTIELVRYGVEGSLNTPTLIVGTGKYIQNGGKLFCSHADSKSGLIRKTASGGKVLLKGQPQLIVANGLSPLQILSNTGTAQDVHNFGVITNGAVGFRIADTFSDTTYGTAYAPNLIGTATNNEDTTYNI